MFSMQDLKSIDRGYFAVKAAGYYGVMLQSKNTKHCWYISSCDFDSFSPCRIYHTHHEGTAMHDHGRGKTLRSCMEQIRSHDEYQLAKDARKRRLARERRRQRAALEADGLTTIF